MKNLRVYIPDENLWCVEFIQEGHKGIAEINKSLIEFEPKEVFRWHLSLLLELDQVDDNGFPVEAEEQVLLKLLAKYRAIAKGENAVKPNALFLANITWNKTVEMIWRVCRPEQIHQTLTAILAEKDYLRPFDYRIDDDVNWELAEWHLGALK